MRLRLRPLLTVLTACLAVCLPVFAAPASSATAPNLGPTPGPSQGPAPAREGAWPLLPRPQVVSGFDPPATRWGAGHRGVDLRGRVGQAVRTSLGGTVTFAARLAGRGVVVVDHGGVRTTYEPVSASVRVGDRVGRGEVVGTLSRASSHCFPGACLHWGLLRGETYLDPLTLVGAGPIRLLPLDAPTGVPVLGGTVSAAPLLALQPARSFTPAGGRAGRPGAADPW